MASLTPCRTEARAPGTGERADARRPTQDGAPASVLHRAPGLHGSPPLRRHGRRCRRRARYPARSRTQGSRRSIPTVAMLSETLTVTRSDHHHGEHEPRDHVHQREKHLASSHSQQPLRSRSSQASTPTLIHCGTRVTGARRGLSVRRERAEQLFSRMEFWQGNSMVAGPFGWIFVLDAPGVLVLGFAFGYTTPKAS